MRCNVSTHGSISGSAVRTFCRQPGVSTDRYTVNKCFSKWVYEHTATETDTDVYSNSIKQDRHCTYNVALRRFRVAMVAVEKYILSVCVRVYVCVWLECTRALTHFSL